MDRARSNVDIFGSLQRQIDDLNAQLKTLRNQNLALPDWVNATLAGTWVAYGAPYATPSYWKDSSGIVHLRGAAKLGTVTSTIFTLPVGFRPAFDFLVTAYSGGFAGGLVIQANGLVVHNTGTNAAVVFDNITFRAEG